MVGQVINLVDNPTAGFKLYPYLLPGSKVVIPTATIENIVDDKLKNVKSEELTYANLVNIKRNNLLVVGKYYKIIDYVATSTDGTILNSKVFKLLLLAINDNLLSEQAILECDDIENSNQWIINYCIDNDKTRFDWAKADGKGVIYYMKDDKGNEAPYDFYHIRVTNTVTFSENSYNNIISPIYNEKGIQTLNKISIDGSNNKFGINCTNINLVGSSNNTFGINCTSINLNLSDYNVFEDSCDNIEIGSNWKYNVFKSNCLNITIKNQINALHNSASHNTIVPSGEENTVITVTGNGELQYQTICYSGFYKSDINHINSVVTLNKLDNYLRLLDINGNTVGNSVLLNDGGSESTNLSKTINISYQALVNLRNNDKLVPGYFYRITDYETIVRTPDWVTYGEENPLWSVSSAKHKFDLIVQAIDVNKISEKATATLHENDKYFLNCRLSAWEILYCLDNNRKMYCCATSSGKGVIYYMKDEWGNEAPYDFKNVLYTVANKITSNNGSLTKLDESIWNGTSTTFYTFSFINTEGSEEIVSDYSIMNYTKPTIKGNLVTFEKVVHDNVIYNDYGDQPVIFIATYDSNDTPHQILNNQSSPLNFIIGSSSHNFILKHALCNYLNTCNYIQLSWNCENNNITNCSKITLEDSCKNNIVDNCYLMLLREHSSNNTISGIIDEVSNKTIAFGGVSISCLNQVINENSEQQLNRPTDGGWAINMTRDAVSVDSAIYHTANMRVDRANNKNILKILL